MPAPGFNMKGKDTLDDARPARGVDTITEGHLAIVTPERRGSWDPAAADLEDPILAAPPPDEPAIKPTGRAKRGRSAVRTGRADVRRRLHLTQQALALRVQGLSMHEIGRALGVDPGTVTGWFATHRRTLAEGAIDAMLDEIAVPIAAENLVQGLLAGDKDYTLETLKGRGQLKRHTAGDVVPTGALPALSIVFEAPVQINGGAPRPGGQILGSISAPKVIDATVVSDVGGADHDALDTVPARVLPSGHDAPSHTAPTPSAPLVLGVGEPVAVVPAGGERGSAVSVPGTGRPVLP
jgi:AcrR family transcriptional regulator